MYVNRQYCAKSIPRATCSSSFRQSEMAVSEKVQCLAYVFGQGVSRHQLCIYLSIGKQ
jgi:hypothetical protein